MDRTIVLSRLREKLLRDEIGDIEYLEALTDEELVNDVCDLVKALSRYDGSREHLMRIGSRLLRLVEPLPEPEEVTQLHLVRDGGGVS